MATVSFVGAGKVYRDGTRALADLTLDVADGEFMVLVGPSGCGKTTALRMVAGLEDISEGEILIGGRVVNGLHPRRRDVAMVFQNYALYPHMSVYRNIAFALKVRKLPQEEIRRRVEQAARTLGLTGELDRKPAQLSGGQRQRVAMGRAIVRDPQAFLMDEPLSNLDAKLRVQMRAEISRIQHELGATTIYVTHDQVEAMTMGDRVAVLRKGRLQQVDPPQRLYERPANLFVASFIGSPEMNLVEATLARRGGRLICLVGSQELTVPATVAADRPELERYIGRTIALGLRPEHLEDAALVGPDGGGGGRLRGRVVTTELLGSELLAHVELDAAPVVTAEVREVLADVDQSRITDLEAEARARRTTIVARFDVESAARAGSPVQVAVDTRRLHFFDLETESAIGGAAAPESMPGRAARGAAATLSP
ncbi:MAG TPA: sn-glycerol-3-phosphate ABC transporter ATP-binding protein UgpC [Gaiellaceae bacterium]|nr:sn-glycerol-3-phosphate ABC transporter ATP-binding protein UgpC [Gaiellaceae bacterium]